jgi:hypothetical protein
MANGFPILLNAFNQIAETVQLLTSDFEILFGSNQFVWGIYDSDTNQPVLISDNTVSFGYKQEYKISDYPIQKGTFANYNKVELPFIATIRMSVGGSLLDRAKFLDELVTLGTSTQLFNVITPEHVYLNANIIDYDYQRTTINGAGMIVADIKLMEIRLTAQATFNNTQSTTDKSSVDGGQVAPSANIPTAQQPTSVAAAAADGKN